MDPKSIKTPGYLTIGKVIAYAMYIWIIYGIVILGLQVFLLAFSANPTTPFVHFVYNAAETFLQPFRGIFPPKSVSDTGYIDTAALFAIIIYAFIGWGFSSLIDYIDLKIKAARRDAALEQLKSQNASRQTNVTATPRTAPPKKVTTRV